MCHQEYAVRCTSITLLVLGALNVLFALSQIGPASESDDPCYLCPGSSFDAAPLAGGYCLDGGTVTGESACADATYATVFCRYAGYTAEDSPDKCTGTWVRFTCGESQRFYARAGGAQCSALQALNQTRAACCEDGPAPPHNTALVQLALALGAGVLKLTAGSLLSCCAGAPTRFKLWSSLGLAIVAALLDVAFMVLLGFALTGASSASDLMGNEAARVVMVWLGVVGAWQLCNVLAVVMHLCEISRALRAASAGIDKAAATKDLVNVYISSASDVGTRRSAIFG